MIPLETWLEVNILQIYLKQEEKNHIRDVNYFSKQTEKATTTRIDRV